MSRGTALYNRYEFQICSVNDSTAVETAASTAVVLVWKISVLLCKDEYDIIKKNIFISVNFTEPVLYIYIKGIVKLQL